MASLHRNFLSGTITDNPLLIAGTTINSAEFANLPAVASPDYMWLVLDPTAVAGNPELVKVTAHTASATSITVTRGQQSTTARQHLLSTIWRAVFTKNDAEASLLAQSGVAAGDLLYASSATSVTRLPIGVGTTVLHGGGSAPSYSQIVAGDIASDAVTTAKILNLNVTTAKIADLGVTTAKIADVNVTTGKIADLNVTTGKIADKAVTGPKMLPTLCQVSMSAAQSITNNSNTALSFDTEDLDALGWHAGGSPTLITPTIAGWYEVRLIGQWQADTDFSRIQIDLQKGGVSVTPQLWDRNFLGSPHQVLGFNATSHLIQMNGTTDNFRVVVLQINTSTGANTVNAVLTVRLVYPT